MFAGQGIGQGDAEAIVAGDGGGTENGEVSWQKQVMADAEKYGPDVVTRAMVDTGNAFMERNYSKEQQHLLHWHKRAAWALPRALALDPEELRLIDGIYFRAWVCELDGLKIDGHVYVDTQGSCTICGH